MDNYIKSAESMKPILKNIWTYYYLLLILMFGALAYNYANPGDRGLGDNQLYYSILWLHFIFGAIALLIGPLQLSSKFRNKSLTRHRLLGKTYMLVILISGIAGFWMAFNSLMPMFGYSLAILDVVWLYTTGRAYYYARNRMITEHQLWIKRSFLVTNVFVVFRFTIPLCILLTPKGQAPEYPFAISIQLCLWGMLAIFEWRRDKSQPISATVS